ncbi:Arc family DNA-binding protein [Xenorhabdus sp. PB61.4]|nr:Arc family DNA-binding protein [Xenorhabdus sp. PB61.4]
MSRDPQINIRLPQDLKEAVHDMASYNKRSVNAEIVAVLLDAVRKHRRHQIETLTEGAITEEDLASAELAASKLDKETKREIQKYLDEIITKYESKLPELSKLKKAP